MELEDFLSSLDGVKKLPSGYSARCPAHNDHDPSLSVNAGREGGIVLLCHRGCATEDVVAAMGLSMSDLAGRPHITAEYQYRTADGELLWVVERWANPKTFRCRPGLPPPAERVLYREDALAWGRERHAVTYIPEGEKDANRLGDLGFVSTCNVGGAGAWLPHYAEKVAGCHVVVIADNDAPGIAHAREVAASCATTAASVRIVRPRYGNDLSEMLDLGWGLDALEPLPEDEELAPVLASNVIIRPVEWLWPGYLPRAKVTTWDGDPGDGKSMASTDVAARASSGALWPDESTNLGPVPVIMITAEDDPEDTIVPRLRTAGADLSKIHLITHGRVEGRPFDITKDVGALARLVLRTGTKLVVLDPLMALLGTETDSHNDASVRAALYPLYRLALDTGCAVLVIRHLNKGQGKAVYRGGGSIAFIGAARAGFTIGRDPEDRNRRILACIKMNIAPEPPSLAFSIENGSLGPFIKWHGIAEASAQEVMDGISCNADTAEILDFLNTVVPIDGEPMTWRDIVLAGKREGGYTEKQLRLRRSMSRLVKITGHEGNRSTRWGYLSHQVDQINITDAYRHVPSEEPVSPTDPQTPKKMSATSQADGQAADLACPDGGTQINGNLAARGEYGPPRGQMAVDEEELDYEARVAELETRPLVCGICGIDVGVSRYAAPWWVLRCLAHSPLTYQVSS